MIDVKKVPQQLRKHIDYVYKITLRMVGKLFA
jgi:hypothetical protein